MNKNQPLNSIRIFLRNIFLTIAQRNEKEANIELLEKFCDGSPELIEFLSEIVGIKVIQIWDLPKWNYRA